MLLIAPRLKNRAILSIRHPRQDLAHLILLSVQRQMLHDAPGLLVLMVKTVVPTPSPQRYLSSRIRRNMTGVQALCKWQFRFAILYRLR
jgi:hypothetical protein